MNSYAILRMEKRKIGDVGRICNHHERLKETYKSNPDIDTTRTHLNYHIVQPEKRYRNLVLERIEEVGAKRRKDSIVLQDCLITASPEWIKSKSDGEQRAYFNRAYEFMEKKIGKENMISAVIHLDETTPHMHLCFVPITKDNHLSSKEIIGGPKGLKEWQDKFYDYMSERFQDLSRGIPKSVSHRQHVPTFMFKVANDLYNHYEEICNAINDIGMVGNAKKKDNAIALLGKYAPEMAQLSTQLRATDKRINYLEKEIRTFKNWNEDLRVENYGQSEEIRELNRSLWELNRKQRELQKLVDLIPEDTLNQLVREERKARRNKAKER